jgi:hypothetical protein
MRTRLVRLGWSAGPALVAVAALGAAAPACLLGSGPPLDPYVDDAGPPDATNLGDDGSTRVDVDLGPSFAVAGLQPSHGPWTGGTRTTIAGRGFSSKVHVWIGATELDPSAVFASDPTHIAVVTPQSAPGPADVRVHDDEQNQDATLAAGFFYDSFVVVPSSGATTGGTRIALQGSGTHWTGASSVAVGSAACSDVAVNDATHLACTTPAGAPGSQDVAVTNADGSIDRARDAFTYSDSPDGYRGGLYGGVLSGNLKVIAFDSWAGTPLVGGKAIAGGNIATALTATLDGAGVAQLSDPSLTGKVTVTVAAKCHQPITFVDVPVDTVTAYLDPVLDLSCAMGDPPSNGNYQGSDLGEVDGELVWNGGIEFQRSGWTNIPQAQGNEQQTAYVFGANGNPLSTFQLPAANTAVTPMSPGMQGYQYALTAWPGNDTIYALAGLEDRTANPPRFEPFAMGVARGIPVQPGVRTTGVDIPMTTLFDHQVTTVPQPPATTPRGPDRLVSQLAVTLGPNLFAILPQGTITSLLPVAGNVTFGGVPSLDGTLAGESYDLNASAVTGQNAGVPLSVVTRIDTTDANDPITIGGFVGVPGFVQPGAGTWGGTHVQFQETGTFDLSVTYVSSAGGLVSWEIVAPAGDTSFDVPDLSQVAGVGNLYHGPITTSLSVARIGSFDYGSLRYGQLSSGGWSAYAQDSASGAY